MSTTANNVKQRRAGGSTPESIDAATGGDAKADASPASESVSHSSSTNDLMERDRDSAMERETKEDWEVFGKDFELTPELSASALFESFVEDWFQHSHITRKRFPGAFKLAEKLRKKGSQVGIKVQEEVSVRACVCIGSQSSPMQMKKPPFVKMIDKITFVASICLLVVTEFVMLRYPQFFHHAYTLLIIPLLIWRYFHYHSIKYVGGMICCCWCVCQLT
jgi:hypothetical protein